MIEMQGYWDIIIRCVAVYVFMLLAIRITGKRELAQLNTADAVLILLVSNAVQNAMVGDNTTLWGGLLAAAALFILNLGVKRVLYKIGPVRCYMVDKPIVIVNKGAADPALMRRYDISEDELEETLREHGVEKVSDARMVVLESDGTVSVIANDDKVHHGRLKKKRRHKLNM